MVRLRLTSSLGGDVFSCACVSGVGYGCFHVADAILGTYAVPLVPGLGRSDYSGLYFSLIIKMIIYITVTLVFMESYICSDMKVL